MRASGNRRTKNIRGTASAACARSVRWLLQPPWEFTEHAESTDFALGPALYEPRAGHRPAFHHRRNAGEGKPGQHGPVGPRHAEGKARPRGADRYSDRRVD